MLTTPTIIDTRIVGRSIGTIRKGGQLRSNCRCERADAVEEVDPERPRHQEVGRPYIEGNAVRRLREYVVPNDCAQHGLLEALDGNLC
jgi:hypothetical protein